VYKQQQLCSAVSKRHLASCSYVRHSTNKDFVLLIYRTGIISIFDQK